MLAVLANLWKEPAKPMEGLDLKLVALKVERLHLEKTRFSGEAQKPG
jgi:hypothetical protein